LVNFQLKKGSVLFKYESDGKLINSINDDTIKRNCIARLCNPKQVGYISTIGVVDEVRGIGIGKTLLSKAILALKMKKNCIGVYLHVIKHNKSAINFYLSNEFNRGKYHENFYKIQKYYYDCIVFYKIFERTKVKIDENAIKKESKEKIKYQIISNFEDNK